MNRVIFIFFFLFVFQMLSAQKQMLIRGKVFDSETGNPISEVHVFIKGSEVGSITDESGIYLININSKKDTLVYSHIQYRTYEKSYNGTNLSANILLDPMVSILPDAVIKPVINISKGMMFDVTDYFLLGDSILYSGFCYHYKKNKNPWIVLKSNLGDTIFSECIGIEGTFYKDCFDNIHYLTKHTSYQIIMENDSMWFEHPTDIEYFKSAMYDCLMEVNGKVLFSQYLNNSQMLNYYCVDKETYEVEIFRTIADEIKLNMLAYQNMFFSMGSAPTDADLRFEKEIMYKPIFAPIIRVKDDIYIINYTDSKIERYDTCLKVLDSEIPIYFHNAKFCKNEIVVDDITGKVYAIYRNQGKTSIKEMYLDNGTIGQEIDIPDFFWIDNIKVRDNKLYFLYREKFSSKLRALYRMNLD